MNAIEKMQQEGTLDRYLEYALYAGVECPHKYGLESKCNGDHAACWNHALTKDYEGVND